jgi:hypothetical protein
MGILKMILKSCFMRIVTEMTKNSKITGISKYTFVLKNIDTDEIDRLYGLDTSTTFSDIDIPPKNTTKISDLIQNKNQPQITFFDETRKSHKCILTMINFEKKSNITSCEKYNCFWDRNPFETIPMGCPLKYVPATATKKYHSEISKDIYTIRENITLVKASMIQDSGINIDANCYYETDGVFCSFNCVKAFILDNKHNKLYDHSMVLLHKMYNEMNGTSNATFDSAPSWRLLREYGGNMDIHLFRNSFNRIDYVDFGVIKPKYKSVGMAYEERLKF